MKNLNRPCLFLLLALFALPSLSYAQDISSYSHVMEDGSLKVKGRKIWLYGIYIPQTGRTCRTYQIPVQCGQRALLALEFKIGPYFVTCQKKGEQEDGSLIALCRVKGEDLSAWMLQQGWAVALPDAPFEYKVMEKIARRNQLGIWGMIVGP